MCVLDRWTGGHDKIVRVAPLSSRLQRRRFQPAAADWLIPEVISVFPDESQIVVPAGSLPR